MHVEIWGPFALRCEMLWNFMETKVLYKNTQQTQFFLKKKIYLSLDQEMFVKCSIRYIYMYSLWPLQIKKLF